MGKGKPSTIFLAALFLIALMDSSKAATEQWSNIQKVVDEILGILKDRDQLQDIKELLNIDATLKRIEKQNEDISKHLMSSIGRSGTGNGDVQNLELRIDTLEDNVVANVQGGITKMDAVQKQADSIRSELETRLGKMMNLITTVYKLNEQISSKVDQGSSSSDQGNTQSLFLTEQLENLEKVVSESMSVMKQTFLTEIRSIKSELLEPFSECRELASQVEDMKSKCDSASEGIGDRDSSPGQSHLYQENQIKDIADSMMRNLTRIQREINANLTRKLQDLETRISQNTTPKPLFEYPVSTLRTTTKSPQSPPTRLEERETVILPERSQSGDNYNRVEDCRSLKYDLPKPQNCWELKKAGASCNGPYIIYPKGIKAVYAYCDMIKDEGGWTVIMRRGDFGGQPVNFNQNWKGYKEGFGDINGEFWLGNDNIRLLTSGHETMLLQVTLEAFDGSNIDIEYDQFWIESEESQYRMHLGNVNGSTAYQGSSLRHHNGRPFSTHDKNNGETRSENCAARFRGGWWFNRCHYALLTAPYFKKDDFRHKWQGMQWHAWKGNDILKAAEMKLRPKTRH